MSGSRGTVALVLVVALLFDSMALSDAFCAGASFAPRQQARARRPARLPRQFARRSARNVDVMLSGEAMAIGVAVAGATTIAVSRGLSALAGAFRLADYRTTSGHDLRLDDEALQSKRRRIVQPSDLSPPPSSTPSFGNKDYTTRAGDLTPETGTSLSGSEADMMDWREQIRQASQLPDDVGAGLGSAILGAEGEGEEGARSGDATDDGGGAGLP